MNKLIFSIIILCVVAETIVEHQQICGTVLGNTNDFYTFTGKGNVYFHLMRTTLIVRKRGSDAVISNWVGSEWESYAYVDYSMFLGNVPTTSKIAVLGIRDEYNAYSFSYCVTYCGNEKCKSVCPNECSGNGRCITSTKKCDCDIGYVGKDCHDKKGDVDERGVAWYVYVIPIVVVAFIIIAVMAIGISNGMIKPRRYLGYYTEQAPLIPPKLTIFIVKTTDTS